MFFSGHPDIFVCVNLVDTQYNIPFIFSNNFHCYEKNTHRDEKIFS